MKFKSLFRRRNISNTVKIRIFNCFVGSVFLYNSELWTLTLTKQREIDAFHRRLLRNLLNIRWPNKISNTKLYEITKAEAWSLTIKRRRLNWTGHMLRLPDDTPVKLALKEALTPGRRPPGGQKLTWLKLVNQDLAPIQLRIEDPATRRLAHRRQDWRKAVRRAMSS